MRNASCVWACCCGITPSAAIASRGAGPWCGCEPSCRPRNRKTDRRRTTFIVRSWLIGPAFPLCNYWARRGTEPLRGMEVLIDQFAEFKIEIS
jgi:hypothetical protein